jgi:acyl-CoA thioester hydrolase
MKKSDSGWRNSQPNLQHTTRLRVRYADTDAMGWVYYANYLVYFEVGRTELIRHVWRAYSDIEAEGLRLPVVETGCRYISGARYDDQLDIESSVSCPSSYRIRFDYRIRNGETNVLLAEGFTVHCFLTSEGKLKKIPEELLLLVSS